MQSQNDIDQLIIKFLQESISEEEKARLYAWLRSSEKNQRIFSELTQKNLLAKELHGLEAYDEEKGWTAVSNYLSDQRRTSVRNGYRWWTAAAAVLIVTGYFLIPHRLSHPQGTEDTSQNAVKASGSKSKILLPDGTVVMLNKGSEISYNDGFGQEKREIRLVGEAYFEVAKIKSVPLVVIAGPLRIKEIGTAFNVRAYGDEPIIETSLIRGSVEVYSVEDSTRTIIMHPNEKVAWKRNSTTETSDENRTTDPAKTVALKIESIRPNPSDSSINEIVWLQDRLTFSHEPFFSVAQKMERWYRVKFIFGDESSEQLRLNGSLEKESLPEALDALSTVTPFEYSITDKTVTIHKRIKNIPH